MPAWRRFERWVSGQLRKIGLNARVSCQSHGGLGSSDVDAYPFHIECKCYEKGTLNISEALNQAKVTCVKCDRYPMVVSKNKHGEIVVTMDFSDWLNFVKEYLIDRNPLPFEQLKKEDCPEESEQSED